MDQSGLPVCGIARANVLDVHDQGPADPPDFDYINEDKIDHDLLDPICHGPLRDPVIHSRCGHMFCTRCINRWVRVNNTCPSCRDEIVDLGESFSKVIPITIKRLLDELKVRHFRCNVVMERGRLRNHPECIAVGASSLARRRKRYP